MEPSVGTAASSFLRGGASSGAFEEMFQPDGSVRAHWRDLLEAIGGMGQEGFEARAEDGRRILREHGVSVPLASDPAGTERAWELDFLPLLLDAGTWRFLETGLIQRARLLNGVLQDLHGTQRLVRDGFLPAPFLFANPGFLRACQAIGVPRGIYLHTYAVDLARSPDGQWWVLADRTQAPVGLGFAQESRTVTSRVLPELVRAVRPRPLAGTLRIRRENLRRLAPTGEAPTIVLLTPGPRNEAYFEHAYLARLLGFTLVEGDDLTVRDCRVFIKTLDGLRRVDVILRYVADALCDPLELRGDSLLGVPGLVEATRAGHVVMANALGSGLVEGPGFLPFLPSLCRHVLGEDPILPSVPTWWCGQSVGREHVAKTTGPLLFRSAFSLAGESLAGESGKALMRDRPHETVAQEPIRLSRLPATGSGRWQSRPFVLRLFVVRDGDSYVVMPGGLARVVSQDYAVSGPLSLAGLCKDVWVLPDAAVAELPHSVASPFPQHERAPSDLPSRTTDNLFWLGRYTERLEHVTRLVRCVVGRLADDVGQGGERQLSALGRLLAHLKLIPSNGNGGLARETLQKELLLLLFKEGREPGVRDLLGRIQLTAFAVRSRLSADTWRILNGLAQDARQRPARLPLVMSASILNTLVRDLAAFSGMVMENMTRGHGWVFLELGRRIERASSVAHLLDGLLALPDDQPLLLEPALEVADSVMTHRRRYFDQPHLESVLELLLQDPTNPRSAAFQVARIRELAAGLPDGLNPDGVAQVRNRIAELPSREPSVGVPSNPEAGAGLACLHRGLFELSELLSQVYFSHVPLRVN